MKGSGGVEAFNNITILHLKDRTVRLSISPSQGDDPGFKSRPEHEKWNKQFLSIYPLDLFK